MKDLTHYITESLKSSDYNKVIKQINKLFIENDQIVIKESQDNKIKFDNYGLHAIYLPSSEIGEWRTKLKNNLPYCKVEPTYFAHQFNKPVSAFTITFNYNYEITDSIPFSNIIKARLRHIDTNIKKNIKTCILDYLKKEHDFNIFFDRMTSSKISFHRSYLDVSEDLMPAVITYIKFKLKLNITDNSDFNKQATEYTVNK